MGDYRDQFFRLFQPQAITLVYWLDILAVSYLTYRLFLLVRGTRAWRIVAGVLIFILALAGSRALGFSGLHWILDKAAILAPVALVILLLPEVRQGLEKLGQLGRPLEKLGGVEARLEIRTVEEIVAAVTELASGSVGALIVLEKTALLDEVAGNGVRLDAKVSAPLLVSIFFENNPLHDGAVVVRQDCIVSAACRLPLSESSRLDQNVHMRHRAAVGITETTDALAIVVSEERGTISYAVEGKLRRLPTHLELRDVLNKEFRGEEKPKRKSFRSSRKAEAKSR